MLSAALIVPLLAAAALVVARDRSERAIRTFAAVSAAVPLVLLVVAWLRFDPAGPRFQLVEDVPWIPSLGVGWRLGVDGIALAVATLSALLFVAAVAYPVDTKGRARQYFAWMLFLEATSLGVFLALDLLLFYVFFDLGLVGMFFLIGRWGHGDAHRAAIKFFLYTLAGSLTMLLAILALYLASDPHTFDMRVLIARQPLAGAGLTAGLALLGFLVGLGIKTPVVPFHTWLPPAHVDAPGPGSAILAGVLLKMGTYGLIRIPYSMMTATFQRWSFWIGILGLVSILYGALVALAQRNLKRRIAYTSINHMGYVVLGIAAAAGLPAGAEVARRMALTGATVEMVAHGLITGSLFLIAGSFWRRGREYDLGAYGGLAGPAPVLAGATTLAAFASLGLPGLAGFVAEIQIFLGTFGVFPWLAALALLGVLFTAALFLLMLRDLFFGDIPDRWSEFPDLEAGERAVLGVLLGLVVLIGLYPRFLLQVIDAASGFLVGGR